MSGFKDLLPALPPNPPVPRFMLEKQDEAPEVSVQHQGCEAGISCIKDHMGRAHLYLSEALRFSSAGTITPEARQKVRLARSELQCEDDFAAAMTAPAETRAEAMKLLAGCRSTWKAMDLCGIDTASGTVDDLADILQSAQTLWDKAYEIESQYKKLKEGAAW
jgi:hypothetical protein